MRLASLIAAACLSVTAACDAIYVGSAATVITTDKTVTDHAVSLFSGKDCSTIRTERGQTYCKEDEVHPEPTVHCYSTLGGVDCYRESEDPSISGRERLGRNDHNTIGQ